MMSRIQRPTTSNPEKLSLIPLRASAPTCVEDEIVIFVGGEAHNQPGRDMIAPALYQLRASVRMRIGLSTNNAMTAATTLRIAAT